MHPSRLAINRPTDSLKQYRERLRNEVRFVDSRGVLQVNRIVRLELEALYEPLRLKIRPLQ